MTPAQREAVEALSQHGSQRAAAQALGISRGALRSRLELAHRWSAAPEGVQAAVEASGLDMGTARHGWRVIPREDGGRDSVFWKAPEDTSDDLAERLGEILTDLPMARVVPPPDNLTDDLLTLIPVADLHSGMMAWQAETGEDYSTRAATERLVDWTGRVVGMLPACGECVILFNGDTLHANDQSNVTPRNKHGLDTDTRHFRTLDMTIEAMAIAVNSALVRHRIVRVVVKPGNHDPEGYMALLLTMRAHYRQEPRVIVDPGPSAFWAMLFGRVLLLSHHGHRAEPKDLVLGLASEYAELWGKSRYRYLWTAHKHHLKAADIGGVQWEQSRAVTARDAHAASYPYPTRAELQGVVYHRDHGEIQRVRVSS